ncbi:MAG: GNAT family N-acetyltransferase [Phycisphaerae bacterium]|nr:GNAT family N-acetyltransferase [Phycisphaerae bacterium]
MARLEVIPGRELSEDLMSRWRVLQKSDPVLSSPYFCPEFTMAVATVRSDVFVGVLRAGNTVEGFFPFQRNILGNGRPVGGALSDYHGIVGSSSLPARDLLRQCGLKSWCFDHLVPNQQVFADHVQSTSESHVIDLSGGFEEYRRLKQQEGSDVLRRAEKRRRQLEREHGPVVFRESVTDPSVLTQLLAWKSAQYVRSSLPDIFSFKWTRSLLERILFTTGPEFSGVLSALYVNGELGAAHMGMRSASVWHWWFPSHRPNLARYSPGVQLRIEAAKTAPHRGITILDMGKGDHLHKTRLRTGAIPVAEGAVELPSLVNWAGMMCRRSESFIRRSRLYGLARLPGRSIMRVVRRRRFS